MSVLTSRMEKLSIFQSMQNTSLPDEIVHQLPHMFLLPSISHETYKYNRHFRQIPMGHGTRYKM